METKLRPPAVPLVTVDPYFNIWSKSDNLYESETTHWTGHTQGMVGLVVIDGTVWRFLGGKDRRSDFKSLDAPALKQTNLDMRPLSSIYTFEGGGIVLTVDFTTPLLLENLDVMSRPVSYVTFHVTSKDDNTHNIQIYFDFTGELAVDVPIQKVVTLRKELENGSEMLRVGTETQDILKRKGDNIRIDWGYACLVTPPSKAISTVIGSASLRDSFIESQKLPNKDASNFPRSIEDDMPVLAAVIDYGYVDKNEKSSYLALAYDDIFSVEYFGDQLPGYWARNGLSFEEMVIEAITDYPQIMEKCNYHSERLINEAIESGGKKYADILALAYRQAIAAHKLVADNNGNALFFSKENFSNGCMATVDVSYPSLPLFLLENSELAKGMLRPIFRYAESDDWPYEFAPHDVGRYPKANGQAYGMAMERQMPIEECGNMLIMTAAICLADGRADFAKNQMDLLHQWADYLVQNGMDPGNQLCTDDFGGHLAHNTNLSVKAIIGIASYGKISLMIGDEGTGNKYIEIAKQMASKWEEMAREADHYKLTFDSSNTWSLKYNLIWDKLLDLNIFDPEIRKKEIAYYKEKRNQYGTPLDNRKTYTKADWLVWAATLAESKSEFEHLVNPLWDFLNESFSRVPFTDWYYTIDGRHERFINRSVVGGLFIKLLADRKADSEKHSGREDSISER